MLSLIDTHAHLTDDKYRGSLDDVIKDAQKEGVEDIFTVAYNKQTITQCVDLCDKYENVYAIIGVHPDDISDYTPETERLIECYANHKKVLAIGEIGLDYHNITDPDVELVKKHQKNVFIAQLILANKLGLPVEIHTRDAIADTIDVLEKNKDLLKNGGVVHCFSEGVEEFKKIKDCGLIISVGGVLTFKNGKKLQEVVKYADLNDIIIETDCPYLTPEPYRGKQINQPKFVKLVAEKIAELKGVSLEDVVIANDCNVRRIFKKFEG